ncbi:MAG TPA: nucleoside deaminase [bacterium]|nr:nucleoside deaminase [bacterium]
MNDEGYMRLAIAAARQGVEQGQTPFGACIVHEGEVLACGNNQVWARHDITAHAEIEALRIAGGERKSIDLSGATIYCTCEPCPMCFGAIHWAKISRIVYGCDISDAREFGFNELPISNQTMKREGGSGMKIEGGLLREENRRLFEIWAAREDRRHY